MTNTLDDFNVLFIVEVNENVRKNVFHMEDDLFLQEDFGDGYYIMMSKDESLKNVKILQEFNNEHDLIYAQPLIGPIPSFEEAEIVGRELSYVLDSNPGVKLSEALALWDHQFNITEIEDKENKKLLN